MMFGTSMSECGHYRYTLERELAGGKGCILWVMLNPSTADAEKDDHTIRRVRHFSAIWGFRTVLVGNLYAYRTSSPRVLRESYKAGIDVVGDPRASEALSLMVAAANGIVCAWGQPGPIPAREDEIRRALLQVSHPTCLGYTQRGFPRHPLRLSNDAILERM